MRAVVYESLGPAREVLHLMNMDVPEPAPGEVRVRVLVSGVNPTDWKQRSGTYGPMRFPRMVPNQDGAGVIDAVGTDVDPSRVGERVWLWFAAWQRAQGTAAEFICLPQRQAVRLPDSASFDLGASLGIPALTAALTLLGDSRLSSRTVLVAGGAGAVGNFAVQLARRDGARVVTTVSSPEKAELARAAGAAVVINYRDVDAAHAVREACPEGVDRIIEVALRANLPLDLKVVKPGGTIVTFAAAGEDPQIPVRALMSANLTLRFLTVYTVGNEALSAAIRTVSSALEDGTLIGLPVHRFSLEETAAAHEAVEGGAVGKVLIDVAS